MEPTSINGRCYDWQSITATLIDTSTQAVFGTGVTIMEITKIDYNKSQDHSRNHGSGTKVHSKGKGNWNYEASMTISMYEFRKLIDAATSQELSNLPLFNITVEYKDTAATTDIIWVKDTIVGCSISPTATSIEQNNMFITVDVDLEPSDVTYGKSLAL